MSAQVSDLAPALILQGLFRLSLGQSGFNIPLGQALGVKMKVVQNSKYITAVKVKKDLLQLILCLKKLTCSPIRQVNQNLYKSNNYLIRIAKFDFDQSALCYTSVY